MGKINILSFEVANLIAAGEVVDRPASAIKEMIENSIDAGAKHITVEIQNGGITFMRISDDGCGMDPSDLPLAIKRHATSKIRSAEDLDGICTLGFRGEALAAISAVSKLRIISKQRGSHLGSELIVNCGEIIGQMERGCSDGTTIIVEDLFENVPARRKFLKRDVTETTAVCANVEKIALSHPDIAFRLITDGQIKLDTAGDGKLFSAIYSVFGREFANRLIEVSGEFDGISVKGYIGRSDNVKSNRNYENFYINKRFIKSRTASAAIEQAYVSYMPSEKFPVCVLFIDLNPARVDVNVHPAKLEVKFTNEKPVFEAIYYAVKQALEKNTARPEMDLPKSGGVRMSDAFVPVEKEQSLKARQITIDMQKPRMPEVTVVSKNAETSAQKPQQTGSLNTRVQNYGSSAAVSSVKSREEIQTSSKITSEDVKTDSKSPIRISQTFSEEKPTESAVIPNADRPASSIKHLTAEEYIKKYLPENPVNCDDDDCDCIAFPPEATASIEQENTTEKQEIDKKAEKIPEIPQEIAKKCTEPEEKKVERVKRDYKIVGEAFNSYIIVEIEEKILLIDKHAAHERIIFEQLKKNMMSIEVSSQLLMLPIEIMLMTDEVSAIDEYRSEIESVGFEFSCSRNTVSVTALPVGIEQEAVADMFAIMADRIKNGTGKVDITRNILFEKALYQASCKAAIKAGREYAKGHGEWVVEKLMELPDITFCPHGRPVAMELSKKNIDRQFERT